MGPALPPLAMDGNPSPAREIARGPDASCDEHVRDRRAVPVDAMERGELLGDHRGAEIVVGLQRQATDRLALAVPDATRTCLASVAVDEAGGAFCRDRVFPAADGPGRNRQSLGDVRRRHFSVRYFLNERERIEFFCRHGNECHTPVSYTGADIFIPHEADIITARLQVIGSSCISC